jgi:hypothetical protein
MTTIFLNRSLLRILRASSPRPGFNHSRSSTVIGTEWEWDEHPLSYVTSKVSHQGTLSSVNALGYVSPALSGRPGSRGDVQKREYGMSFFDDDLFVQPTRRG